MELFEYLSTFDAAKLKGFKSRDAFLYHIRGEAGEPKPVFIGKRKFWNRSEITAWDVLSRKKGRPTKSNKGETNE